MARILIEAIQNGSETLAKDIIQGGTYGCIDSQTSKRDGTALFFCCSRGYLELAKLLLERGASVSSTDKTLATPLHGAVDNGHLDIVKLLISHGADVNAQTHRGDTPLHMAAFRGFMEIVRCLVEAGAECNLVNSNSITPELQSRAAGHEAVSAYLRSVLNERYPGENEEATMDSLIRLSPPIETVAEPSVELRQQPQLHQRPHHHDQQQQQQKHMSLPSSSVFEQNLDKARRKTMASQVNDLNHDRPKNCHQDNIKYKSISFVGIEPPSEFYDIHHIPVSGPPKIGNQRENGLSRPSQQFHPASNISINMPSPAFYHPNSTSPLPHTAPCLSPQVLTHSSRSISPQSVNPYIPVSHSSNIRGPFSRRPSTGSTGSCLSDISGSTASDASSLLSNGSDGSGGYMETRREDVEVPDFQGASNCYSPQPQDRDVLGLTESLGVKYPPPERHMRRMSAASTPMESSEFSDIYDSSLFSMGSLMSGPPSSMLSGPSSISMDSSGSSGSRSSSSMDINDLHERRPHLGRALSINCPHPVSQNSSKLRPYFNKSISTENRASLQYPGVQNGKHEFCSSFDSMPSNDLSSPSPQISIPPKSRSSMTCINIPLN